MICSFLLERHTLSVSAYRFKLCSWLSKKDAFLKTNTFVERGDAGFGYYPLTGHSQHEHFYNFRKINGIFSCSLTDLKNDLILSSWSDYIWDAFFTCEKEPSKSPERQSTLLPTINPQNPSETWHWKAKDVWWGISPVS